MTGELNSGAVSENDVLSALRQVQDPDLHRDIVSLGFVRELRIDDGHIAFKIVLTTPACPVREQLQAQAQQIVANLPGVKNVDVQMDAEVRQSSSPRGQKPVDGVRNIIAVASNKGGVGKSTTAVNLALALSQLGAKVGVLDADITGPNIPTLMGIESGAQAEQGLSTVTAHGVRFASIGLVLKPGLAVIWRGPMIATGVRQLLHDVPWAGEGELDYLLIDLPPGTSDAPMSIAQEAPIAGVVIVTTPQKISLEDATKAVAMFEKMQVPVFGIVENMSYFACPHCDQRADIFGHGGARVAAENLGLDFIGEIPLDIRVREGGDDGVPIVVNEPSSRVAQAYVDLAKKVAAKVSTQQFFAVPIASQ